MDDLTLLHSAALLCYYSTNTFENQPLSRNVKCCMLIPADRKRPICFFFPAWLHRRRNWWGRAAVFTSEVTDWVTACRLRMVPLWREPACSPPHLQLPCLTEKYFTSVSWTEPNALTPYPELFFPWAFSYLTSSTGSPIKCCDTRTFMQICKTLSANPGCWSFFVWLFFLRVFFFPSQNQNCLSIYITVRNRVKRHICYSEPLLKIKMCSGAPSGSQRAIKRSDRIKLRGFRLLFAFALLRLSRIASPGLRQRQKHWWYFSGSWPFASSDG